MGIVCVGGIDIVELRRESDSGVSNSRDGVEFPPSELGVKDTLALAAGSSKAPEGRLTLYRLRPGGEFS